MALQHLRSSTAHKRPIPTVMSAGQIAVNTNEASPALFFKDSNGDLVKVGPVHIGPDAPNSSPASVAATALVTGTVYQILTVGTTDFTLVGASANTVGTIFTATGTTTGTGTVSGQQGVEKGEQWLDTTGGTYVLKIYDGTAWRSESGTFVDVSGDNMTGNLTLGTDKVILNATSGSATFAGPQTLGTSSSPASNGYTSHIDNTEASTAACFSANNLNAHGINFLGVDGGNGNAITYKIMNDGSAYFASNVGIGTTSPSASIHLEVSDPQVRLQRTGAYSTSSGPLIQFQGRGPNSTNYNFGKIQAVSSGSNNAGELQFFTNNAGSQSERMRLTSDGKLGIGSSSPSQKLTAVGNIKIAGAQAGNTAKFCLTRTDRSWSINNETDLRFYTGSGDTDSPTSATVVFTGGGNVGIGQNNPSGRLEVMGGYVTLRNGASSFPDGISAPIIYGSTGGGSGTFDQTGNLVLQTRSDAGNYSICFVTGDTPIERMRITSTGSAEFGGNATFAGTVLIGGWASDSSTPGSTNYGNYIEQIGGFFTNRAADTSTVLKGYKQGTLNVDIKAGGSAYFASNVGIGTSSPSTKLSVIASSANGIELGQDSSLSTDSSRLFFSTSAGSNAIHSSSGNLRFFTGATAGASSGTERVQIDSSGNVKFEYTDSSTSTATQSPPGLRIYNKDNTLGRLAGIHFSHGGAGTANAGIFHVTTSTATGSTNCLGDLAFYMKANGSSTMSEAMRIVSSGRLLVGTTTTSVLGDRLIEIGNTTRSSTYATITTSSSGTGGLLFADTTTNDNGGYRGIIDYSHSLDAMRFYSASTEHMRISNVGNVGIGTTDPQSAFTVRGSTPRITLEPTSDTQNCRLQFCTTNGTVQSSIQSGGLEGSDIKFINQVTSSENVRFKGDGNVGIGTSNIESRLHLRENSNSLRNILYLQNRNAGANAGSQIAFNNSTNDLSDNRFAFIRGLTSGAGQNGNALTFGTNPSGGVPEERLRIDSNGRLLFGTSSALSVSGITAGVQVHGTATNNGASISIARFRNDIYPPLLSFGKSRNATIAAGTIVQDDDELGQISFNGDDGTDLNSSAARIQAFVDGTPAAGMGGTGVPGRLVFSTAEEEDGAMFERMHITNGGSLRIHQFTTNTPGFNNTTTGLSIEKSNGGSALFVSRSNNASAFFNRNSSGNLVRLFCNGNQAGSIDVSNLPSTTYNTTSDYRLKENVTPVTDGITRLQQLKPSRFNFISHPDKMFDGFIAHEVQTIVPEAITGEKDAVDDDGNPEYQGIDQSKIVPLLTAALQEAIAKIETLEQRLSDAGIA